ncbi:MAG: DNA-directed RNA polymerase subunit P [Candidatus Thermoplasmatota archaeon]|nr:DNA-directed RNA polymerase subunit P [Candidatus Thermoplasmatota archaeon]
MWLPICQWCVLSNEERLMVNYKCASCGARLDMDLEVLGLTCRVCGEKIFYKIRPSTKKTVVSD